MKKKWQVLEDRRAWIAGLSDKAAAGSWLGAIMKQSVLPNKEEIQKLQRFIDETLCGRLQIKALAVIMQIFRVWGWMKN